MTKEQVVERFDESDCHKCGLPVGVEQCQDGELMRYSDHLTALAASQARCAELEKVDDPTFLRPLHLKIGHGGLSIAEQYHLHKLASHAKHKWGECIRHIAQLNVEMVRLLEREHTLTARCAELEKALKDSYDMLRTMRTRTMQIETADAIDRLLALTERPPT